MSITMLTQNTGYIPAFTNAGIVHCNSGVILIDNGWGVKEGRFILDTLEKNNLRLVAVINTHTHFDHAAANYFLQKHTKCKFYTSGYEALMMQGYSQVFPILFTGEINPIKKGMELAFSYTKKCDFEIISPGPLVIDGAQLEIVDLAGHSYGQIGVVSDNILFCGDAIMEQTIMTLNKLPYLSDPTLQRGTLRFIKSSGYDWYVASHGPHFADPAPTCDLFSNLIDSVQQTMLDLTAQPIMFEEIFCHVTTKLNVHMRNMEKYSICKSATLAMLNELVNNGQIAISFQENRRYYTKVC